MPADSNTNSEIHKVSPYSILICTRNRGNEIELALGSLAKIKSDAVRIVVVDQSDNDITRASVGRYLDQLPIQYLSSTTQGKTTAANLGLEHIATELVLMIDDDCEVTAGWHLPLLKALESDPKVALVYGDVIEAFEAQDGFIPAYRVATLLTVKTWADKCKARGIGANCGFRRDILESIGGFNPQYGPGTFFRSCSDGELSMRVLERGFTIVETPGSIVLHHGFRPNTAGKKTTFDAFFGIAACTLASVLKGHLGAWRVYCHEIGKCALVPMLKSLLRLRPSGLAAVRGAFEGSMAVLRMFLQGKLRDPVLEFKRVPSPTPAFVKPSND